MVNFGRGLILCFSHPTSWCQSNWTEAGIGNTTLCTFEGTDTTDVCFDSSSNSTVQKIRQCDQDETLFTVLLVAVVVVFNLASLLASLRLNRIINYVELYKKSRTLLGCQTQPILHRAAVFQLIDSEIKEDTELFNEIFQKGNDLSNFISRPNSSGRTPLHIACDKQSPRKLVQLLKAGAAIMPDGKGEKPEWESHYLILENSDRPQDQELVKTTNRSDLQLLGIRHTVEEPELVELLRTWNSAEDITKEEAEQRVIEKFVEDTKVLTIPLPAAMEREEKEEMKEIVRKWNSNHTTKCEYLTIGINLKQKVLCLQYLVLIGQRHLKSFSFE